MEAMSVNEPAAKEWPPAAAQAQPGVCGPGRADSWAGRAPLVKGNNVVQQGNRPFPAGRRDLISTHTGGQGRIPCSPRWGTCSKPETVHRLLQVQRGPGSRSGEILEGQAETGHIEQRRRRNRMSTALWAGRPTPGSSLAAFVLRLCPHQEYPLLCWEELSSRPSHHLLSFL